MGIEQNIAGASQNILGTADKDIRDKQKKSGSDRLFDGLKIGISISASPDLLKLGYSAMHLQDAAIEFARYLLVNGATLVYGGDLRAEGFTHLFSELARLYTNKETQARFRFKNYFAWPVHLALTKTMELDFRQNKVQIEKIPPPNTINADLQNAIQPDSNENKRILAKSLTYMRETMISDCDARIFLGGQIQNFRGVYPGIVEEAYLALSKKIPVYFIGAYGGATREIIKLLQNKTSEKLNENYQFEDKAYEEFYHYWNSIEKNVPLDYAKLATFFTQIGPAKLAALNGLSEEENSRLFEINYLPGMIFYVLKGLTKVMQSNKAP